MNELLMTQLYMVKMVGDTQKSKCFSSINASRLSFK